MTLAIIIAVVLFCLLIWKYHPYLKTAVLLRKGKVWVDSTTQLISDRPLKLEVNLTQPEVVRAYSARRTELAWELFKDARPLDDPEELDDLAKDCFRAVDSFKRASFLVRDDP